MLKQGCMSRRAESGRDARPGRHLRLHAQEVAGRGHAAPARVEVPAHGRPSGLWAVAMQRPGHSGAQQPSAAAQSRTALGPTL
jgi:hypothetical protein